MSQKLPEISTSSKECFSDATERSQAQGKMMGSSHFVYSLLTYSDNSMFELIKLIGANPEQLTQSIKSLEELEPPLSPAGDTRTPAVYGALSSLERIMNKLGDTKASMEVILASFCGGQDQTAKTLISHGVNESKIIEAVSHLRSTSNTETVSDGLSGTKTLSQFGIDLTAKAREGKIDPVIGRDSETRRVMQILSRRTKNNPVIVGEPGVGKALENSTLIPVADKRGYVEISHLQPGDRVFSRTGEKSTVIGVYPQGEKKSYKLTFNDTSSVICSEDHLFSGWTHSDFLSGHQMKTLSVADIMSTLGVKSNTQLSPENSWYIPLSHAVDRDEEKFDIHPYIIGALAGGGMFDNHSVYLLASDYVAHKISSLIPHCYAEQAGDDCDSWVFFSSKNSYSGHRSSILTTRSLKEMDADMSSICDVDASEKTIPRRYMYGSIQQRTELLQGLMDSSGDVILLPEGDFHCVFFTKSAQLAHDVVHVARSCGLRAYIDSHSASGHYEVIFWKHSNILHIFSEPEKLHHAQHVMKKSSDGNYDALILESIEYVGNKDSTCIYVDNAEHLFVCGEEHIVTHNTAIIEGLARRIVAGDCPEQLKDKTIYALDLAALSAGAKYQGEYESRVKDVLSDISKSEGKIITFIDEIHMIASNDSSPMNLSNMLKPMLARGEMHLIGATTLSEYRQFISTDPALDRRFQQVIALEPSVEDTIGILRGIKEKYETHHGIKIQDAALISCAELSDRYLSSRFLPDKAIDLMDEASSRLTMLIDSRPEEIDVLEKKVRSLEIEEVALKNETDSTGVSSLRLDEVQQELTQYREQLSASKSAWENQREGTERMRRLRQKLASLQNESEKAEREGDYGKVSELRYDKIPELRAKIQQEEESASSQGIDTRLISEEVTPDIVADVVSSMTGVPANKMNESDVQRVMSMGEELSHEVVGQPEAVNALVKAVKRSRAGVSNPNRPVGNFLFAGPSGTGKTQLSKALAQYLYDDPKALITFSMEEYTDKASINKLIGSPAGYVGYGDTPALEAVRNRPSSVVLFDELEKADDQVITTLLSIMEEGNITLNNGTEVDFTNTIIIFTSNLGAGEGAEGVDRAIKARLRPEFINRLDAVISFNSLSVDDLKKVVDIQIRHLEKTMSNKKLSFVVSDNARSVIAEMGHDPLYGARPVRRIISGTISDMLADSIITGEVSPGDTVRIDVDSTGNLVLSGSHHEENGDYSGSSYSPPSFSDDSNTAGEVTLDDSILDDDEDDALDELFKL